MEEDDAIRAKAHELWEAEGRPEGRAERHWEEAREIVALRGGAADTARTPVEDTLSEPVEPAIAVESHGEVPGLTDLGKNEPKAPSRKRALSGKTAPGEI